MSEMVDELEENKEYDEEEAELVRSALDISDVEAHEIMTPRVDVYAINIEDDIKEVIKEGEIFKHSRIPVFEDTIDNIIGILPIKELAKAIFKDEENVDIKSLLYKPLIIPRNRQLLDLLEEFKSTIVNSAENRTVYTICRYVQELAADFHSFYNATRVITDDKQTTLARLSLVYAVKSVIAIGLNILGVTAPEKM